MEVESCAVEVCRHAASLLARLRLQRKQAHFCDCVLRHEQNAGLLYPAHRCILAASSPVLASLLSSSGALVELQESWLSDSVLAPLLDYIYTGTLPHTLNQGQYCRLLTAAGHLQMNELQESLREAWRQTEMNAVDDVSASNLKASGDPPSSPSTNSFEDPSKPSSSEVKTFDEAHKNSASMDSSRDFRQMTQQNSVQSSLLTDGVREVSGDNKEVLEDQFHSSGLMRPEAWQRYTGEELLVTCEDRGSSSSLSHPCCGAVPVICHGSRATACQLPEVCSVLPRLPAFQSPISSGIVPDTNSASSESITPSHNNLVGPHYQDSDQNEMHIVCDPRPVLNLGYKRRHHLTDQFVISHSKNLAHLPVQNHQPAHCDYFQPKTKPLVEDLVPPNKDWSSDGVHSKHQQLSCFEISHVSTATSKEEESQDWESDVSLPTEDSDTGNDSLCEDLCIEMKVKEEHGYSFTTDMNVHSRSYGDKLNRCLNMYTAEKSRTDAASGQHEFDPNIRLTAMQHRGQRMDLCLPLTTALQSGVGIPESITFLEPKQILGTKTVATPMDTGTSDAATSTKVEPYDEHPHSHCQTQEETQFSHRYSQHANSHHSLELNGGSYQAGSFSIPCQSSPKPYSFTEIPDLVDTVAQSPGLAVPCQHRSDTEEKGVGKRDRTEAVIGVPDKAHSSKVRKGTKIECFDETNGKMNVQERIFVGKDRSRRGGQVPQKARFMEAPPPATGENAVSTCPVRPAQRVPASARASMCIPSTISANRPAHVASPPAQPFQCSLCERSFSQRGSLNRHVRSHLGVRPFSCPCCPMTFSRQYRVTEHMRVHQRCALGNDFHKSADSSIRDKKHN
ncbi:uncharacterized protein ACNS7B_003305 isoform 1-T2 [Menidia menidia]